MQNKINEFVGKKFIFSTLKYTVLEAKIVNDKAALKTDRRTFVFLESELDVFMTKIKFLEHNTLVKNKDAFVVQSSPLQVEIIAAESNAQKVSNKLMEIFDTLSDNPTDLCFKKAAAMVNVSNSIVNIQMAQIKFSSLKR